MAEKRPVVLEPEPGMADIQALVGHLTAFNAERADGDTPQCLLASVRNEAGELIGGLFGATYLGWLHVQVMWLHESQRGQGYGSELLAVAEAEGLRRGCKQSYVETLSFQALPFYEKCGYQVFSRLPDFPPGGARYALTKLLG